LLLVVVQAASAVEQRQIKKSGLIDGKILGKSSQEIGVGAVYKFAVSLRLNLHNQED
jgi:hypothetical protein